MGQSRVNQETNYIMQGSAKGQSRSCSSCRGQSWAKIDHVGVSQGLKQIIKGLVKGKGR